MDDEGLPQHLVAYINDHGHSLTSLFALNKASTITSLLPLYTFLHLIRVIEWSKQNTLTACIVLYTFQCRFTHCLCMVQAVQDLRSTDLSMWASRYNLFVLWSADRQHPWDGLPDAERIAATLEIGKAEGEEKVSRLFYCAECTDGYP